MKTCYDKLKEKNKERARLKLVVANLKKRNPSDPSINQIKRSTKYTTLKTDIQTLTQQKTALENIVTKLRAQVFNMSIYQTQKKYKLVPRYISKPIKY